MIKGTFFLVSLVLLLFIFVSLLEFQHFLATYLKTFLFYSILLLILFLFIYYIAIPIFALLRLGKRITFRRASQIISRHFPDIDDKLLNTLELGENVNSLKSELVVASINQRIALLNPLPFKLALSFKTIKRYFLFFVLSVVILLLILAFKPKVITEGSLRFIHYSTYYEPLAPFTFTILTKELVSEKNKDFKLELKISGKYIPENVYIQLGNNQFLMNKGKKTGFYEFILKNLNNKLEFNFFADKYRSQTYTIEVLPAPLLRSFTMDIVPPAYTGYEPFSLSNTGDCNIPSGSIIKWNIKTAFVQTLKFGFPMDTILLNAKNQLFSFSRQIRKNTKYSILLSNEHFSSDENLSYSISVVDDQFPEILVTQLEDSLRLGAYYFMLSINDDYGFHDLKFISNIIDKAGNELIVPIKIELNNKQRSQDLFYYFDFNAIEHFKEESYLEYYFELRDNDLINGYKMVRSQKRIFNLLTSSDIRKRLDEAENVREAALSKTKNLTKDIQKDISDFKKKQLNSQLSEWEKKNFLKNISEKQKELDKFIKDILDQNKKSNQMNNQFYDDQKNLLEKQRQIQEILEQILDQELKDLLKEIEKLSEKFNEQNFEKLKENIDFSYKNMEKRLDRSLELLKRYQVEENVLKLSEDLNELAEKQNSLSNEIEKNDKENLLKNQEDLKKEFSGLSDEYKKVIEKNSDLKSPYRIDQFHENFKDLEKKFNDLEKDIPKGGKKKIINQQKDISRELQKLSDSMKKTFDEMEMQTLEMNLDDLRQLIDNLLIFSHNQEKIYLNTNKNLQSSPAFPGLVTNQSKIGNDFSMIEDSLRTLMDRVPQLNQLMFQEVDGINFNIEKVNDLMEQRNRREALKIQRFILNSANTLSLILSELMDQMQNQMQGGGGGNSKTGKPDQVMQNLKKQQQKLKEQLEKLMKEMQKNGEKSEGEGLNEQIVKTLAEQEIFNQMLKEMQNSPGVSPETDKKLKEIKRLSDQNIDDLINKNISPELFNRNQKILTRLLDSEKAEKEREEEERRESKEGVKNEFLIPEELKKSFKKEERFKESLIKGNLNMKNYYKNLSNDYFRTILK